MSRKQERETNSHCAMPNIQQSCDDASRVDLEQYIFYHPDYEMAAFASDSRKESFSTSTDQI
jgi:hypothetical protein